MGKNFDLLFKRILTDAGHYELLSEQLQSTRATQDAVRQADRDAFNNNIFGGNLAQLRLQLKADRNDADTAAGAAAKGRSNGLDGDFAAGLAGPGNVALAQELSRLSRAEVGQFQTLYNQRTTAQGGLGNQAAAVYQPSIDALAGRMTELAATLNTLEAAVERGARNGTEGKARATNTKQKAGSKP